MLFALSFLFQYNPPTSDRLQTDKAFFVQNVFEKEGTGEGKASFKKFSLPRIKIKFFQSAATHCAKIMTAGSVAVERSEVNPTTCEAKPGSMS